MKFILAIVFALLLAPGVARAEWRLDGTLVRAGTFHQEDPDLVSDGAGGVIVVWMDSRNTIDRDIYAQRFDARGEPVWSIGGVLVSGAVGNQMWPHAVTDGAGGVIVSWDDSRNGNDWDIYAQRIDADGNTLWATDGVPASNPQLSDQDFNRIVADGSGGAIVLWQDDRNGIDRDLYVQHLDASGNSVLGQPLGVSLTLNKPGDQWFAEMAEDGAGGAIITWSEGVYPDRNIIAQRIDGQANEVWPVTDVPVCNESGDQMAQEIIADGNGGAIIAWHDRRPGAGDGDIYAQRLDAAGFGQWTLQGEAICVQDSAQLSPILSSDGSGGAVIAWWDERFATNFTTFVQRIDAAGVAQWTADGKRILTPSAWDSQTARSIVSDGAGGAVIVLDAWTGGGEEDLYVQRVDGTGATPWGLETLPVCAVVGDVYAPRAIASDRGGSFVAWEDGRYGTSDVYVQRIEPYFGDWGHPEPTLTSVEDVPADQGGTVAANWQRSGKDALGHQLITHYSLWRATPSPNPVWEWVSNQTAAYLSHYALASPTLMDSTGGDPGMHWFQVFAHTTDSLKFWPSKIDSGYSVDNLAPNPPALVTAERIGDTQVELTWSPGDAADAGIQVYRLYRGEHDDVVVGTSHFLLSTEGTVAVDKTADTESTYYYRIIAVDRNGNASEPSRVVMVTPAHSDGVPSAVRALTVRQNYPNPFSGETEMRFGLPQATDVSLEVFDVAGRRVYSRHLTRQPAGWRSISFIARGDGGTLLPSGVYFYRVSTGVETKTRKMVISR